HHVPAGAHPGSRDPARFGRVALDVPPDDLSADLVLQIETLRAIALSEGSDLVHVKAHGALYNTAHHDERVASAIVSAVRRAAPDLVLFVFPTSAAERAARTAGLRVAREGFIDRAYEADGTLRSRTEADALITDPGEAAAQALSFVREGGVRARGGVFLQLPVDTLCVHGDTPGAAAILRAVRAALVSSGVAVRRTK